MSEVGRLIAGRYRLTEHIGSGAMGTVWQAHDERLHRTVALKQLLLQPGLSRADAEEARERAMREGRIAARLHHPNAVTVYDVVEDASQPVLIMEYVPSKSLSAVLDQHGTLPPPEVARIGAQVATALTVAHVAGIVHRDIKPGNVLLAEDGTVKITDFGISRATGDVTVTATGMLAGTPAYLAPEVAKGEHPGPPSDVFSLASTLYAAVEGQPPFGLSDNTLAVLHAVAACRTVPPRQAGPLTALLMQMLRAKPDDRPTMSEVARVLASVAAGQTFTGGMPAVGPNSGPTAVTDAAQAEQARLENQTTVRTRQRPSGPPSYPPSYPSGPPSYPPRQPGTPVADRRSVWRKRALTAVAIVLAALLGILVANIFTDTSGDNATALNSAQTSPLGGQPSNVANNAPTTAETTTTEPTTQPTTAATTTTNAAKPNFASMYTTLSTYYALAPQQTAQSWTLLTPAAQAKSGGYATYQQYWSTVAGAQVDGGLPHGDNTILARVRIVTKDGKASNDAYQFTFVVQNGTLLINDATALGGQPGRKHG